MIKAVSVLLKFLLPRGVKEVAKRIIFQYKNKHLLGSKFWCPVCGHGLKKFLPLADICDGKFVQDIVIKSNNYSVSEYETLNVDKFLCPICGAQDKARLYALYLKSALEPYRIHGNQRIKMVHFAPEGGLGDLIKKYVSIDYITADLHRDDVDQQVDLTNMSQYADGSIDVFICSHILEHIQDEEKALSELARVLAADGWGVLMVPILLPLTDTYEDPAITTEEGRLKAFGLEDHLRVHSKTGFRKSVMAAGFNLDEYGQSFFGKESFSCCGIADSSVLYIVRKQ